MSDSDVVIRVERCYRFAGLRLRDYHAAGDPTRQLVECQRPDRQDRAVRRRLSQDQGSIQLDRHGGLNPGEASATLWANLWDAMGAGSFLDRYRKMLDLDLTDREIYGFQLAIRQDADLATGVLGHAAGSGKGLDVAVPIRAVRWHFRPLHDSPPKPGCGPGVAPPERGMVNTTLQLVT